MECETRERLWQDYNRALDIFSARVDDLGKAFTAQTFAPKIIASRDANDRCKAARAAWEDHIREHGCSG